MSTRSNVIRAAKFAGLEVSYNGEKVYVDGLLAYDPDSQSTVVADNIEHENNVKLWMYGEALKDLAKEDRRYQSNANMWQRWDNARRLWWIAHAEHQAQQGMNTIGVDAVTRAVEIRLTRQMP